MPNQRALISVSDKTGLVRFAQKLHDAGVRVDRQRRHRRPTRRRGPARPRPPRLLPASRNFLTAASRRCIPPSTVESSPAAHRNISANWRSTDYSLSNLVVVNLYPFQQTVADPGVSLAAAVEQIDIGGVALLRAAAKNFESVAVVCEPADYGRVAQAISDSGLDADTRQALALKAFRHTAAYDAAISDFLARQQPQQEPRSQDHDTLSAHIRLDLERVQVMRYGENPHQQGALYRFSNSSPAFEQLHGQEMSYNNWLDLDGSWQAAQNFDAPTVAIIKHSNPCGLASADTLARAYDNALASDPISGIWQHHLRQPTAGQSDRRTDG